MTSPATAIPKPLPLLGKQRKSQSPSHTKLPSMAQSPWGSSGLQLYFAFGLFTGQGESVVALRMTTMSNVRSLKGYPERLMFPGPSSWTAIFSSCSAQHGRSTSQT